MHSVVRRSDCVALCLLYIIIQYGAVTRPDALARVMRITTQLHAVP
jgi:hypothetical protein